MTTLATLFGAAIIVVALRDIFQQLFNPGGGGSLSRSLMHVVWGAFRRGAVHRPSLLSLAGPFTLLTIIVVWVALLAGGWALIYWPRLPELFLFSTGLDPANQDGFLDALYLSLTTLTTLGYGTITPTAQWLRILSVLEALVGFGLLTASLAWVASIYPVFARRRSLAHEAFLMRESVHEPGSLLEATGFSDAAQRVAAERALADLTSRLVAVHGDLDLFPVTYYFHQSTARISLPVAVPLLLGIAERAGGEGYPPEVRKRAAMLRAAVEDFSVTIASKRFLGLSSVSYEEALEAYSVDHLHGRARSKR